METLSPTIQTLLSKYPTTLHLVQSKAIEILLGKIRDKATPMHLFRSYNSRLITILLEEAIATTYTKQITKESVCGKYEALERDTAEEDYIGVCILRSANAMLTEYMKLFPTSPIWNILIQRVEESEDKHPLFIYEKHPVVIEGKKIILMDPMLASGGSCIKAIEILINNKIKEEDILFVNLISTPDGIEAVLNKFPKINIVTAKIDPVLLQNKYISPGLGDFGDRFYGTN